MKRFINDCGGRYATKAVNDSNRNVATLLWGDPVTVTGSNQGGWTPILTGRYRNVTGRLPAWVRKEHLAPAADSGLLELYIIDVGQGDGVLSGRPTTSGMSWMPG